MERRAWLGALLRRNMPVCVERENQLRKAATDIHPEAHCCFWVQLWCGFQCMIWDNTQGGSIRQEWALEPWERDCSGRVPPGLMLLVLKQNFVHSVNKWSYSTAHPCPFFLLCSSAFETLKFKVIRKTYNWTARENSIWVFILRMWSLFKPLKPLHQPHWAVLTTEVRKGDFQICDI